LMIVSPSFDANLGHIHMVQNLRDRMTQ
jgi:hypothetical protein